MSISDMYRQLAEPQTPNDLLRAATPARQRAQCGVATPFVLPSTPTESKLAAIWAELLGLDLVGIHDNFFELSGDSLLMTQVLSRIYARCQVDISVETFFDGPTVAQVAAVIDLAPVLDRNEVDVASILDTVESLSDAQIRALLDEAEPSASPTSTDDESLDAD